MVAGVYGKVALAGVWRGAGDARWLTESLGPSAAYCLEGNVADIGERSALEPRFPADSSPSNPSPTGWGASSSGGGVGVRGGAGKTLEAIPAGK
jgi:hypothetical protein